MAADGTLHQALGVATLETRAVDRGDKAIYLDAGLTGPVDQVAIDLLGENFCTGAGNQGQFGFLTVGAEKLCGRDGVGRHYLLLHFLFMFTGVDTP
jgi:hypothetical protein